MKSLEKLKVVSIDITSFWLPQEAIITNPFSFIFISTSTTTQSNILKNKRKIKVLNVGRVRLRLKLMSVQLIEINLNIFHPFPSHSSHTLVPQHLNNISKIHLKLTQTY